MAYEPSHGALPEMSIQYIAPESLVAALAEYANDLDRAPMYMAQVRHRLAGILRQAADELTRYQDAEAKRHVKLYDGE